MRIKTLAAATLPVVTALVATLTTVSPAPASADAATPASLRVASFNIQSVAVDQTDGARRPWRQRRAAVVKNIVGEQVDVIGVQEANPSRYWRSRLVDGATQYLDLRNGLNSAGGHYRLTNTYAFNCVNPRTSYHCQYQYRGASYSDRILYDTDTVELVRAGAIHYTAQHPLEQPRGVAWAVLRSKANGSEFLFTTTHLDPRHLDVREAQWRELIADIDRLRGDLPVVAVGDFNTHKFTPLAASMLPAMKAAGYGDVLNQEYTVNPVAEVRAESVTNAWVNSFNHERRDVATYGYEDRRDKYGNNIDWIFATNALEVQNYKVVLDFDPLTLQVRGVLPSDHNMVRAVLTLP